MQFASGAYISQLYIEMGRWCNDHDDVNDNSISVENNIGA